MANPNRIVIRRTNGSWDSLNPILNKDAQLNKYMDEIQAGILKQTKVRIRATRRRTAVSLAKHVTTGLLSPTSITGIKMRFISYPALGFEMKYNPLRKALDEA